MKNRLNEQGVRMNSENLELQMKICEKVQMRPKASIYRKTLGLSAYLPARPHKNGRGPRWFSFSHILTTQPTRTALL